MLAHKLREALAAEQAEVALSGTAEGDGAYFGGHVKPENQKADRKARRLLRTSPASVKASWWLASAWAFSPRA